MGTGTQPPIGPKHVHRLYRRMDRLHVGEIVSDKGRDYPLQEQAGARMEQSQQSGDGNAAPWPLLRRLAEGVL